MLPGRARMSHASSQPVSALYPNRHMKSFLPLLTLLSAFSPGLAATQPNILFILADDLGWADTSLYGHTKFYKTPNIARLAKRGMTFTRAYTASPLCSPTRSSILTGLNPARSGITSPNCHLPQVILKASTGTKGAPNKKSIGPTSVSRLDTKHRTLAEALRDAGYATGHFGKWHLGKTPYSPLEHGFDVDVPHWPGPGPAGSYVAPWKFPDFDPDTPDEHIEDRMAKEAVSFLEQHRDKPFFLNYWMFSVHAPFDAKKSLIDKYRQSADPKDPQRSPTYAAMVESMDDAVGTLMDTLDRLGLTENTIVIFFSDNGGNMYNEVDGTTPTSNAPLRGGKASMYEGGIRVPMVVSWPGHVKPGTRSDSRVHSDDFHPTLLDLLNLEAADGQLFDGVSFLPALAGRPHDRGPSFTYFPHDPPVPDWIPPSVSVHDGDWKLIRIFHGGETGAHRWKLFNLASDIGERNDLAARQPGRVKQMDALIEAFLNRTGAVRPVANPKFNPALHRPEQEGVGKIRSKPNQEAKKPSTKTEEFPGLEGWKARHTKYSVKNGIVRLTSDETAPYLGVAPGVTGPTTAVLRVRGAEGGDGQIRFHPPGAAVRSIPFKIEPGDWRDISIDIETKGPLGIFQIHVPAKLAPVEIDHVELRSANGKTRRWDF
jgi:arylsulfatase A-like enzyme